jgi:hypothetical protein
VNNVEKQAQNIFKILNNSWSTKKLKIIHSCTNCKNQAS